MTITNDVYDFVFIFAFVYIHERRRKKTYPSNIEIIIVN